MKISELFNKLQDEFGDEELNGEFLLHGNVIIWSYNLSDIPEDINNNTEDDDDEGFSFESASSEELLQEGYEEDLNKFELFLDSIEETDNWSLTDSEIIGNMIVFKIY